MHIETSSKTEKHRQMEIIERCLWSFRPENGHKLLQQPMDQENKRLMDPINFKQYNERSKA